MNRRLLLCCGHAGFSGVPIYVRSLVEVVKVHDLYLASDINEGAFDGVEKLVVKYEQKRGLKSSFNIFSLITNVIFLYQFIKRNQIDVIWAHSTGAILAARIACMFHRSKVKLMITYHGVPFGPNRPLVRSYLLKLIEWVSLKFCAHDCLVFISHEDMKLIASIYPIDKVKHHTINNFCSKVPNVRDTSMTGDVLRFVNTSRVCRQKNLHAIPTILSQIKSDKQIVMTFYGDMTRDHRFMQQILSIDTEVKIKYEFKGEIPSSELDLGSYDFYISTSLYEGFSLSMLDAMATGLPLLTSDVGGIRELKEQIGYVFPFDLNRKIDTDGLNKFISDTIVNRAETRRQIRETTNEHFSITKWAKQCNAILSL